MRPILLETADLVTFTDEILTEKLHYLCHSISCRLEEIVRQLIQESLYELSWTKTSMKFLRRAVTLINLKLSIRVNNQTVFVHPLVLLSWLGFLIQRKGGIKVFFVQELSPMLTSLFKDYLFWENKSSIA